MHTDPIRRAGSTRQCRSTGRIRVKRWEMGFEYRSWCAWSPRSDRSPKIRNLCVVSLAVATRSQPALPHFATQRTYGQMTRNTTRDVGRKVAGLLEYGGLSKLITVPGV
jgi:hypothetical protein